MNNLISTFERFLEVLKKLSQTQLLSYQRRKPRLSDLELISLSLTAEYLGIDSENDLFRKLPQEIFSKIERSVYNKRRRKLTQHLEQLRLKLAGHFNEFEDCFIVDSMPLEVCKLSRSSRSKICKESDYASPDKGYCAAQQANYYGYKLHAVCSVNGVFQSIDLSPASVHDIQYLKDIQTELRHCTLIGDKGYLSAQVQINLFEKCKIRLNTPMRANQRSYKKQPY